MNVWRGSWGASWLDSWGEARKAVVPAKPGAGKLHLPYFEPAWATLKPQNVRQVVSHVSLFFSVQSTISTERAIHSRVSLPLEAMSAQCVVRAARSVADLGFQPRTTATVVCGISVRSGASLGVGSRGSVVGSIQRESRAELSFAARSKQGALAAHRSVVPLFTSARSHFANRQTIALRSCATLFGAVNSTVECATKVSRVAEIDRRDIDLLMLLAA